MTEETTVNLKDLKAKELKELAKLHNTELGVKQGDMGYIAIGSKGDRLAEELLAAEELNLEPARNDVEVRTITVAADKICRHANNYRDDKDYFDPRLVEAYERTGGKFFGTLVVAANDDGTYRTISGNRSFASFEVALGNLGIELADVELTVQERIYTGTEQEKLIAEIADMGLANELQRPMSPKDLMDWYLDLSKGGLTQAAIAELQYGKANAANKVPQISITMGYSRLPVEYLDALHNDFNRHEYAANGVEWLEDEGVPFFERADGPVVIGLSAVNAGVICKVYSKVARRGTPGEAKGVRAVNKLLTAEVLEEACSMSAAEFKRYFNDLAVGAGLIEARVKTETTAPPQSVGELSDGDDVVTDVEEEEALEAAAEPATASTRTRTKAEPKDEYLKAGITTVQAAYDIEQGAVLLADNMMDRLKDLLELGAPGSAEAFMFLLHNGVIEENI